MSTSGNIRADGSVTAAGKGGVCIPTVDKTAQFKKLRMVRENTICFDCPNTRPTWASVNHGVFLCLDCSATHRSMGVHLTFVRSVDLDEWTQRQIDAMRIGGNGPARAYFRKHGISLDAGASKGAEKKYKSRVAAHYRAELEKLVEAEAKKRGEGTTNTTTPVPAPGMEDDTGGTSALLQNLTVGDQKHMESEAQKKLQAARAANTNNQTAAAAKPTLKLASSLAGSNKLSVGGTLRKPTTTTSSSMMLKKKPAGTLGGGAASRLRVNKLGGTKLTMTTPKNSTSTNANGLTTASSDDFEDIEETQKKAALAEKEKKQMDNDEAMARRLQAELNNGAAGSAAGGWGGSSATTTTTTINGSMNGVGGGNSQPATKTVVAPKPAAPAPPAKKLSSMDESLAKMKHMTSDFFSQM